MISIENSIVEKLSELGTEYFLDVYQNRLDFYKNNKYSTLLDLTPKYLIVNTKNMLLNYINHNYKEFEKFKLKAFIESLNDSDFIKFIKITDFCYVPIKNIDKIKRNFNYINSNEITFHCFDFTSVLFISKNDIEEIESKTERFLDDFIFSRIYLHFVAKKSSVLKITTFSTNFKKSFEYSKTLTSITEQVINNLEIDSLFLDKLKQHNLSLTISSNQHYDGQRLEIIIKDNSYKTFFQKIKNTFEVIFT